VIIIKFLFMSNGFCNYSCNALNLSRSKTSSIRCLLNYLVSIGAAIDAGNYLSHDRINRLDYTIRPQQYLLDLHGCGGGACSVMMILIMLR
jgi:hypothetical protein